MINQCHTQVILSQKQHFLSKRGTICKKDLNKFTLQRILYSLIVVMCKLLKLAYLYVNYDLLGLD